MKRDALAKLITIRKYGQQWSAPGLVIAVLNNQGLDQVTWELRGIADEPQFLQSQHLPDIPYAGFARSMGLLGLRLDAPKLVGHDWTLSCRPIGPSCWSSSRTRRSPHSAACDGGANRERRSVGDQGRLRSLERRQRRRQAQAQEFLPGTRD